MLNKWSRYVIEVRSIGGDGWPVRGLHAAGDALEPARITLSSMVDAMIQRDPSLRAMPDTVDFMDRAGARNVDLYRGDAMRPIVRYRLLDTDRKHCVSCTCGLTAR